MSASTQLDRQFREVDDVLVHLKGLVFVRGLLQERGATAAEIRAHSDEIERLRSRLASLVQTTGGGAHSAAA